MRRFLGSLLPWKSSKYFTFVFVCARVRRYVRVSARERRRVHARVCVHVVSRAYPACNACVPYGDIISGPSISTTFFDIIS